MSSKINFVHTKAGHILYTVLLCTVAAIFSSQCFSQSSLTNPNSTQLKRRLDWVFDYVQQNYVDEVDPQVLYEGAIKGMLNALGDPYTAYLDPAAKRSLTDTTAGNFGGVGLSITKLNTSTPERPAYVEVASPIENTPGSRAGIIAGDYITAIDGAATVDMTMEEVLGVLRGKPGTDVELTILRGKNSTFNVTLTRAVIEVPTVRYGMIGDTGYLRIIEFTPETPHRVQDALDSFAKNNFTNLIIDVRDNPGGLITSVVDVADKFIDSGPIVSTKSRLAFENSVFTATRSKTTAPRGMPIIILINKGSASASEILAGAFKDNHLAYLVGQTSYGKGSVQQVFNLSAEDGMRLTMARYYTPSDTNIDKIGIAPDREVAFPPMTETDEKAYADLISADVINSYVDSHPNMTERDIASYAQTLSKTYALDQRLLRRLIRLRVSRLSGTALYDLDYDVQLNAALDILKKENFTTLMRSTKTLKELQELNKATETAAR